ncbi:mechanosensitive ion channel protein 5 [Selaginella moellendorffii]|uniref:mechanosensitive ion channel protein 5 n=1 Tax=Selaginella moellendorffii TaxID=88036 RepID=UPI000D1C5FB4|nr:mechanosensitive ion channel protein 5 [Selaginella moellendorffii]|eukprot:XP_024536127.1 mechanosensitive ion channel protein 5 [Selaginella moellendorffii]
MDKDRHDVVVTIEKQQQQQQRSIAGRRDSPSSSPPPPPPGSSNGERISVVCDAPKSPSPRRSPPKASGISARSSRGSSYNFSEDEQPLAMAAVIEGSEQAEEGSVPGARNKSFDFGVGLSNGSGGGAMASSSSSLSPPKNRGNGQGYHRLPSPNRQEQDPPKQSSAQSSPARRVSSPQVAEIFLGDAKNTTTLRNAIAAAATADSPPAAIPSPKTVSFDPAPPPAPAPPTIKEPKNSTPVDAVVVKAPARLKSKSRLAEPPPPPPQPREESKLATPGNAVAPGSGRLGGGDAAPPAEEEDPLRDVDLPDKYRHARWGCCSLFQLVALVLLTALLVCSVTVAVLRRRSILGLELWKWTVMVLVALSGRLLSGWIIHVAVFFIERNFLWRKRVLYFVYGLRKGVQTALWLTLALVAWLLLFDPKVERSTKNNRALLYVTKVLICLLIAAFVWLAKLLFVKVLASSYHVNTYFDRIQESLFSQYILEKLSGPPLEFVGDDDRGGAPPSLIKKKGLSFKVVDQGAPATAAAKKKDKASSDSVLSIDKLQKMNQRNVSAWNMKRLVMLVKQSNISTLSQTIDRSDDGQENEIQTEWQARAAAKEVFRNVAQPGSKQIVLEDLLRFLTPSEAHKALALFEGAAEAETITKKNLVNWVISVYRERRSLALSLNDTKTAVDKLHHIINAVTGVVIVIIWLLVLGIATSHLLIFASSQLLLIVFIFGNTCKTVFEAIIFLFVMHPYDVGDRCVIDGVQMIVEEMNILTTVFLRYDNEKIYYPNSVLASKPISNYYRSPDMTDAIDFTVDMSTPVEKIAALKERVSKYISSKSAHWHNKSTIVVKDIEDMNRMKMALWVQHTMNYQNNGERLIRRSDLLIKLKTFFQELGIEYHLPPQEVTLSDNHTIAAHPFRLS